ncbi:sugar inositol transporter [Trichoderma arundinaceum]|uniref:Sugar inositol transporter n=1 Tax=Trichoderma arundinaceum TaxID=490622 RepID=A0A395P039_TRIAR|nr:sugar inositol transporter [Trichoderma arundinaceum]
MEKHEEAAEVGHGVSMGEKGDLVHINVTRDITRAEHELGFWQAMRQYPTATFWAMFFSIAVIMSGYDGQIIFSFYALPAFQKRYGELVGGSYEIPAPWQTALGMGNPIGQVLGALASGYPMERFGRRWTLAFFATSLPMLCAGEILGGLAYGFYVVIAPTYASEICPLALRGLLTAFINLAFVIGQFIAQGVAAGLEGREDEWAYKAPFALQWLWPLVILVGLPFAPESPYWLVRQGRKEDARSALVKLSSSKNAPDIDQVLLGVEQTDLLEQEFEATTNYWDLFKGANRVRTEITIMVYLIQVIAGNPLIGYANYFFEQAGLNPAEAFDMGVGNTALGFVGTITSWFLLNYFKLGRRTIYNCGMWVMTLLLFIIGFLSIPTHNNGAIWAMASCMDVLPESQGRTFEELDILFQRRVPLREFKTYDLLVEAELEKTTTA